MNPLSSDKQFEHYPQCDTTQKNNSPFLGRNFTFLSQDSSPIEFFNIHDLQQLTKECEGLREADRAVIQFPDNMNIVLSKGLLSKYVPYFNNMFSGAFKETQQDTISPPHGVSYSIFVDSLNFLLFNTEPNINGETIGAYLEIADFCEMLPLKKKCEEWLLDNFDSLSSTNISDIISFNPSSIFLEKINTEAEKIIKENPQPWIDVPQGLDTLASFVTKLDLSDSRVNDLSFLSLFLKLEHLNLKNAPVEDKEIIHVANVISLKSVNLAGTKVTNTGITHLENMRSLQKLNLNFTNITNGSIASLNKLKMLESLSLANTKIRNIVDLDMPSLRELNLSMVQSAVYNTQLTGWESLSKLTSLTSLNLGSTGITDQGIEFFSNLPLESLNLEKTWITDDGLSLLRGLTSLKQLNLASVGAVQPPIGSPAVLSLDFIKLLADIQKPKITNAGLAHLKGLTSLQTFDLTNSNITSSGLIDLEGFTSLQTLDLQGTQIGNDNSSSLNKLTSLLNLNLSRTLITDTGLAVLKLPTLQIFNLSNTEIEGRGLADLTDFRSLIELDLSHTEITDANIASLPNKNGLISLNLSYTKIKGQGLADLKDFHSLIELDLSHTKITDTGLTSLPNLNLESFNLSYTKIKGEGLTALKGCHSLKTLKLNGSKIDDDGLRFFLKDYDLSALRTLDLSATEISPSSLGRFMYRYSLKVLAADLHERRWS